MEKVQKHLQGKQQKDWTFVQQICQNYLKTYVYKPHHTQKELLYTYQAVQAGVSERTGQQEESQVCRSLQDIKIGHVHIRDIRIIFLTFLLLEWVSSVAHGCRGALCVGDVMEKDDDDTLCIRDAETNTGVRLRLFLFISTDYHLQCYIINKININIL